MKRLYVWLLVVTWVAVALSHSLSAQTRTSDYLTFGINGGYSTLLGKVSEMTVPGKGSVALNFGYELRHGNFLFKMPLEIQYFTSSCNTDISIDDVRIKDTRAGDATLHYEMISPLKETQRFVIPSLGFMFGYSGNDYQDCRLNGSFYVLAGVRVFHTLDVNTTVSLDYATTATYDRYIDDYEDMPNHWYKEHSSSDTERYGKKWGGMASVDMGWELNVNDYDKLKVGAFVNIGLTNLMYGLDRGSCEPDPNDVVDVNVRSYYCSPEMDGKYVVPLSVGISVSYSLNMNRIMHCVGRKHSKRCLPYRRVKHKRRW